MVGMMAKKFLILLSIVLIKCVIGATFAGIIVGNIYLAHYVCPYSSLPFLTALSLIFLTGLLVIGYVLVVLGVMIFRYKPWRIKNGRGKT